MPRQKEIDRLRGFAIFTVVLGHSIIVFPINLHEIGWCKYLYNLIYSFHMPLFFAISGYCYSFMGGYWTYLRKKTVRLLVPYFFFAFSGIVPRILAPGLVNGDTEIGDSVKAILFQGGEYWFLYVLFLIFAIFPLIEKAVKKNEIISFFAVLALSVLSNFLPTIFCIRLLAYYLVFFMFGCLGKRHAIFSVNMGSAGLSKNVLLIAGMAMVCLCGYLHGTFGHVWLNDLEAIMGIIYFVYATAVLPKISFIYEKYSAYSLTLYLLNGYWLVISRTVIVNVLHVSNPVVIILFNLFIDFYISYFLIKNVISKIPGIRMLCGIQVK